MKYHVILSLILTSNIALAGKLKGKVTTVGDKGMLSMAISGMDSKSLDKFMAMAKKNPQASVVITGDLNGDGQVERYSISAGTPIRCQDGSCSSGLVVGNTTALNYAISTFHHIDSATGQPKTTAHQGVYRTQSKSISGQNSSLTIEEKSGTSETRTTEISSKTVNLIIESGNPNDIQSFRKGWDGTVKGGSRSVQASLDLVSAGQSTSTNGQGQVLSHVDLLLSQEQGTIEQTSAKAQGDQQKLDSILNLIR